MNYRVVYVYNREEGLGQRGLYGWRYALYPTAFVEFVVRTKGLDTEYFVRFFIL